MVMKVDELRSILKDYSADDVRKVLVAVYKAIPKKVKEERGIDALINNPNPPKNAAASKTRQKPAEVDPDLVVFDTQDFVSNAEDQNYFAPNRMVPKKKRSNWRFEAKGLYRNLLLAKASTADPLLLQDAAKALESLYGVLCRGCAYHLFATTYTFEAMKVPQTEFFEQLLAAKFSVLHGRDFTDWAVKAVVDHELHYDVVRTDLCRVLIEFLRTAELRELALESCAQEIGRCKTTAKRKREPMSFGLPDGHYRSNELAVLGYMLCAALGEFERGVEFFHKHYKDDSDIPLYVLSRMLLNSKQRELITREFETAEQRGIKPRENLKLLYDIAKSADPLPDAIPIAHRAARSP